MYIDNDYQYSDYRVPALNLLVLYYSFLGISTIAFPCVQNKYIYIEFLRHIPMCVVYIVEEIASLQGLSQLMGVARNKTCTRDLQTRRKKEAFIVYVQTGANSCSG